ncbi:ABC transporter ATP-binding protein [Halobaculum sp. MBLA0147]|uniref:ABC transporter ATP-binding protein n=1 Tax=Halobaculum sp. MBLA0147 TaxID=3079934 RepID=UPI0035246D8C
MSDTGPRLRVDEVTKRYGETTVVSDVSFEADVGVLGLLGPNGAGKSTLLRTIAGVTSPTSGRIEWDGEDVTDTPAAIRRVCGYLPQRFGVYPNLTAREYLDYVAALEGVPSDTAADRIERLLETVNLSDAADERLGTFSGGMRRRVGLAATLLSDPALVIVDEPTAGLDPAERVRFRNLVTRLGERRVVVFSTHVVPDVEATATDVVLLADGRVVERGRPASLIDRVAGHCWTVETDREGVSDLRERYRVRSTTRTSDGVTVDVIATERPTPDAEPREPTLEDAYLDIVDTAATRAVDPGVVER